MSARWLGGLMGGCPRLRAGSPLSALPCSNETGMAKARSALEALGLQPSERDCCRVQQICRAVVSRAAALSATGLAAILSLMCRSRELERLVVNVGVDGELYRAHARYGGEKRGSWLGRTPLGMPQAWPSPSSSSP